MRFISTITLVFFCGLGFSQDQQPLPAVQAALQHLKDNSAQWQLQADDLQELSVTDHYSTQKTGTQHVYISQFFQGIPVYNAIQTIAIDKQGKAHSVGQTRLIPNIKDRIINTKASLSPLDAIEVLLAELKIKSLHQPQLIHQKNKTEYTFSKTDVASQEIKVRQVYAPIQGGQYTLAYQVQLDELHSHDWWNVNIDARDGTMLSTENFALYCQLDKPANHKHDAACKPSVQQKKTAVDESAGGHPGNYLVIPFPYESPNHAEFSLVIEPADEVASPFGWHDTNGQIGAEYSITKGNNAHSFQDQLGSNMSLGDEPTGGNELVFDYPFVESDNPSDYSDAAVVNLFYWLNTFHDLTFRYGFDEAAGNFQFTNYTGAGLDNDFMQGNAQDAFFNGAINNAAYIGAADGSAARVSMYLWESSRIFAVTSPKSVAGPYNSLAALFGSPIPANPIEAEVVAYSDGIYSPFITDACEPAINADELMGKIALIDRGGCFFEQKALHAEAAGAIAVIICNYEATPANMANVPTLEDPTIPCLSLGATECATIREFAGSGLTVSFGQQPNAGVKYLDGDFDSGIITHEAAHGLSTRLTGGPSSATCLSNLEQMGEGWSDFFSLVMTTDETAYGAQKRGAGTYVQQQATDGRGTRRYPYSTDLSINPLTYIDVAANPEKHALGEVWASVLWDLYWALVEKYDFDTDLITGSGGNNLAIQLVIDGMKSQPCSPGFEDGRDAILLADKLLTGGENECLIWEVFARRGIGYYADQGSSQSGSDQVADFEPLPLCVEALKMTKSVSPIIDPGEDITVDIYVVNHDKQQHTDLQVRDLIPADLTFVQGSANFSTTVDGNQIIFDLGDLQPNEELTLSYKVATDINKSSTQYYFDDMENGGDGWLFQPVEGDNHWGPSLQMQYEGNVSLAVASSSSESQQILLSKSASTIIGNNPVLRFYHNYRTEPGQDGGAIQVTNDIDQGNWTNLDEYIWRGKYNGPIDYLTFVIPNFQVFSGISDDYLATYIDLDAFMDEELYFRFNFATSELDGVTAPNDGFWSIDNFALLDLLTYNWESCLSSNESPLLCRSAPEGGTVIEAELLTATQDITEDIRLHVYPNPADDYFNISFQSASTGKANWSLQNVSGKTIRKEQINIAPGHQTLTLSSGDLVPGLYFIKLSTPQGERTEKLIIQ